MRRKGGVKKEEVEDEQREEMEAVCIYNWGKNERRKNKKEEGNKERKEGKILKRVRRSVSE